ncbi:thioesterase II family protein [Actinokineospora cianjurensis]|uniref:Surfactin synthase thioesterase subunit n=1 Tax=Actinokineospora cianjurensis TaxID=585224 RepID=A0A421B0N6_9PSEU|nr:thioesterase domain-containing protein [Actinokineospora cianjurensis]RLK57955.1 surfactin synthase thioesterase subunit [Actinokineospora cianjurensis]
MTWLVELRGTTDRRPTARVIALAHAGGWPTAFRPWRDLLPPEVQLLVAQLPGRATRSGEPTRDRVEPLAQELARAVAELDPLPFAVVGHSFGSVLGYEMTKLLEARGRAPRLLVVSGRQAPCLPSEPPFLHEGSDADLLAHLDLIGGIPAGLLERADFVQATLRAIRADLAALETYRRPVSGTGVDVLAVGASDDPVVNAARLHLWSLETVGAFASRLFTGGHFFLYRPDTAALVAAEVAAALDVGSRSFARNVALVRHTPVAPPRGRLAVPVTTAGRDLT